MNKQIHNEKGGTATEMTQIESVEYYEQVYANKFENLGEIGKFLETFHLSKLAQEYKI